MIRHNKTVLVPSVDGVLPMAEHRGRLFNDRPNLPNSSGSLPVILQGYVLPLEAGYKPVVHYGLTRRDHFGYIDG